MTSLRTSAWEASESRTSVVRQSQSPRALPQARRIVGSGDENAAVAICLNSLIYIHYRLVQPDNTLVIRSVRLEHETQAKNETYSCSNTDEYMRF